MARITVEDCLDKIDSQYDLVLLAKERTTQLNAGEPALLPENNDKNTVIALREIAESKISIKRLEDSAIDKLRVLQEETTSLDDFEDEQEDNFDKIYKGEISKSGTAILPSKRTRRIPEKINLNTENSIDKIKDKSVEQKTESESLIAEKKSEK